MTRRGYLPAALMALLFLAEAAWVRRGAAGPFDRAVRGAVHAWAMPALTRAMEAITMLGSHWVLVPLGALLVWRWAAGGRRREAMVFAAVCLAAELASQILKLALHRPRPEVFFGLLPAETYSFPSGHALLTTVFYGLAARGRAMGMAAATIAILVGLSRVYLGYHYPSDVLGGWTCGLGVLALARRLQK